MPGCTSSALDVLKLRSADCAAYKVMLTNVAGAITSAQSFLSVIPPVPRRPVPALRLTAETGAQLNSQYSDLPVSSAVWLHLAAVTQISPSQFWFDVTAPLPPGRFYRAWQSELTSPRPELALNLVRALTLTGEPGQPLRVDATNEIGPTNAWGTLATEPLTNSAQLFYDLSAIGQPPRLYRLVLLP